jgi:serine/threonine protein kinase
LFISKAVLILAKHSRYRLYVAGAGTGKELDPRSDLFSFGAVLYEMTSGQMAFLGNTAAIVYEAILNRAPIPLPGLKPELPPNLDEIIRESAGERPQGAPSECHRHSNGLTASEKR